MLLGCEFEDRINDAMKNHDTCAILTGAIRGKSGGATEQFCAASIFAHVHENITPAKHPDSECLHKAWKFSCGLLSYHMQCHVRNVSAELVWAGLSCTGLDWLGMGLSWGGLCWARLGWTGLDWAGLG